MAREGAARSQAGQAARCPSEKTQYHHRQGAARPSWLCTTSSAWPACTSAALRRPDGKVAPELRENTQKSHRQNRPARAMNAPRGHELLRVNAVSGVDFTLADIAISRHPCSDSLHFIHLGVRDARKKLVNTFKVLGAGPLRFKVFDDMMFASEHSTVVVSQHRMKKLAI